MGIEMPKLDGFHPPLKGEGRSAEGGSGWGDSASDLYSAETFAALPPPPARAIARATSPLQGEVKERHGSRTETLLVTAMTFVLSLALSVSSASTASAASWPERPVRITVPHAPGGMPDILGRILAEHLSNVFHQQFYVENRPGGNGVVGAALVRATPPDGYNLIVTGFPLLVVLPLANPNVGFDPVHDFTHIGYFGGAPNLFVVNPALGVHTLKELVARVRHDGSLAYAMSGPGSNGQLVAESFARRNSISLTPVGYRSGSIGLMDAVAGHIGMSSQSWGIVGEYVRTGKLVPLAVTSEARLQQAPEIPTFKEEGYPELVTTTWFSLSAPRGLPEAMTQALNREVIAVLHRPDVRARLDRDAVLADPLTPTEFTAFLAAEIARWAPLVHESGITVE
jgi:tripartite-type tricarboxylate transporter receptor subunit TctC